MQPITSTFRDRMTGDVFRIRFEFFVTHAQTASLSERGYFRMFAEMYPQCDFPLGRVAHLLEDDEICVAEGREPETLSRAKAIAMLWLRGFGVYRQTGKFPNDGGRVNVVDEIGKDA